MTDFRVLKENTFKFKEGKIYLMLLKDGEKFSIEVVNKSQSFGRKFAEDRKEAEFLFDITTVKIDSTKTLADAESAIRLCFDRDDLKETMFLLALEDRDMSQFEIGVLVIKLKFTTKAKYGYIKNKTKRGAITISVFFKDKNKPIGVFFGTRFGKDFRFESI